MLRTLSTRGRIGRLAFVLRLFFAVAVICFGFIASVGIDVLSVPLGYGEGERKIWSPDAATFVDHTLGKIDKRWIMLGFFVLGLRMYACAAVQRARDLGVEIRSVFFVPFYWFDPSSKAHCGHLAATPGREPKDKVEVAGANDRSNP